MEYIHFPKVIYAYQGPDMSQFWGMKLTYECIKCTAWPMLVFPFKIVFVGAYALIPKWGYSLKYSRHYCWCYPEKVFIKNVPLIWQSCLVNLFTLRLLNDRPVQQTAQAQNILIVMNPLRGMTTYHSLKELKLELGFVLELNNSGLDRGVCTDELSRTTVTVICLWMERR